MNASGRSPSGLRQTSSPLRARAVRWAVLALLALAPATASPYDPLAIADSAPPVLQDLVVNDALRNRDIPLRVYLPFSREPAPLVLFSHGLGGSREGSSFLGRHWSARGFVAVFLQHPGSDESVWRDAPAGQRMAAMRKAANAENLLLRAGDVGAVLHGLQLWNAEADHALRGRLDLSRVGMAGHSFGALTTEAVSGLRTPWSRLSFHQPQIRAALVMSPSVPARGEPSLLFHGVAIPWMLMTGTRDSSPIGNATAESRLLVFPALPPGDKYELVLDGAEHSVFTDRRLPGDRQPRNPAHHQAILALSTGFWDAFLRREAEALAWLDGDGARAALAPADRWQRK